MDNKKSKYYCPMHPDIVSDKPGTCPKCGGMELVRRNGKKVSGHDHAMQEHDHATMMASPAAAKDFLRRFFVVIFLLIPLIAFSQLSVKYLGIIDFPLRPFVELFFASIIFYFGLVFFQHAKMEIAMRQYGMMTLVSLGVGAGYLISAVSTFFPSFNSEFYLEISTLIWVLLFGHYLESKSSTAAGDALAEVAKLLPKKAHLIGGKKNIVDVDVESLKKGDVVLVKAGEKVPADGVIVKGNGSFDEAHITGESKPIDKENGAEVLAGAISVDGTVEVKLFRVGAESTIGQIEHLISNAKKTKPSAQRLADRAAKWLTFSALGVSILTLLYWYLVSGSPFAFAATLAITVLVIACPHALGLAIPTVSTIATKLAVNNGVFIKDMAKIEVIKNANYVVFDKTGTLTKGNFAVTSIISDKTFSKSKLISIAASLEANSSHVIGVSIVNYAKQEKIKVADSENTKNISGKGIAGDINSKRYFAGNKKLMVSQQVWNDKWEEVGKNLEEDTETVVFVSDSQKMLGVLGLSDSIKKESAQAVKSLHDMGIKVAMMTGDNEKTADSVAEKLGIDTVFAGVLPKDKYKYVKKLQDTGNVVIMAGDGVNDAPALTQADVGVAIGAGTDVTVEAGDVVLTRSDPSDLVRLIVLSKKVYRKMLENLFWALGYNVLAIPAAAGIFIPLGFRLTPAVGAFVMSLSSVILVVNAMSLRKVSLE